MKNYILPAALLVIALGLGVLYFYQANIKTEISTETVPSSKTTQTTDIKNDVTSSDQYSLETYKNTEFGFTIELPFRKFNNYRVSRSEDSTDNSTTFLFRIPVSNSPDYQGYEEYGGYPALSISVFRVADYDIELERSVNDDIPLSVFPVIGRSKDYVFVRGAGPNGNSINDSVNTITRHDVDEVYSSFALIK